MKLLWRYFFLLMISVAGKFPVIAQTRLIDSLKNELKTAIKDSVTVFIYTGLANEYYAYDTVKSMEYLQKGYLMANKDGMGLCAGELLFCQRNAKATFFRA